MGSVGASVKKGDPIPLHVQLSGGETNKYPLAYVTKQDGATSIAGSPFTLGHTSDGLYVPISAPAMPEHNVIVRYVVFSDAGHSILDEDYEKVTDYFDLDDTQDLVEDINDALNNLTGSVLGPKVIGKVAENTAVKGSLGTDDSLIGKVAGDSDKIKGMLPGSEALIGVVVENTAVKGIVQECCA